MVQHKCKVEEQSAKKKDCEAKYKKVYILEGNRTNSPKLRDNKLYIYIYISAN